MKEKHEKMEPYIKIYEKNINFDDAEIKICKFH